MWSRVGFSGLGLLARGLVVLFGVRVAAQTTSHRPLAASTITGGIITAGTPSEVTGQTTSPLGASPKTTVSTVSSLAPTSPASEFSTTASSAASTIPASATPSATYFYTNWTLSENPVPLNQAVNYTYEYYSDVPPTGSLYLYLCQSNTSTTPSPDNTWLVLSVPFSTQSSLFLNNFPVDFSLELGLATADLDALQWPFFFCWGVWAASGIFTCESFSGSFLAENGTQPALAFERDNKQPNTISISPTPLFVILSTQVLSISGASTVTALLTATKTGATVTLGPSTTSKPTPTNSTPTPSSTTHPQASGLSTGAKAGIAIGIILLFLLVALGAFFYLRRRSKRNNNPGNPALRPNTHELVTNANRHELFTKANIHEMEQEKQGVMTVLEKKPQNSASPIDIDTPRELDSTADRLLTPELETRDEAARLSGPLEEPAEGVAEPVPRAVGEDESKLGMLQERMKSIKAERQATQAEGSNSSSGDTEQDEKKLGILQDRIERIRAEKERLERIQRLEELEEETKREIMQTSRHIAERGGGGSGEF